MVKYVYLFEIMAAFFFHSQEILLTVMCWIDVLVQYEFWWNCQTVFDFIKYVLLVIYGVVLIPGVKSSIISYVLSAEAIRDLKMAQNMPFCI